VLTPCSSAEEYFMATSVLRHLRVGGSVSHEGDALFCIGLLQVEQFSAHLQKNNVTMV
jgi:hypothetical protein